VFKPTYQILLCVESDSFALLSVNCCLADHKNARSRGEMEKLPAIDGQVTANSMNNAGNGKAECRAGHDLLRQARKWANKARPRSFMYEGVK